MNEDRRLETAKRLQALLDTDPGLAQELFRSVVALRLEYLTRKEQLELEVSLDNDQGGLICWNYERGSFRWGLTTSVPPHQVEEHFHRAGVKRIGNPWRPETWGEILPNP